MQRCDRVLTARGLAIDPIVERDHRSVYVFVKRNLRYPFFAVFDAPDRPEAVDEEIRWQLRHMSTPARTALRQLPAVGENSSGPLGPGLLASGLLGTIIRDLQAGLADPAATTRP